MAGPVTLNESTGEVFASSIASLASGRSLTFAPAWPCSDASVVFDRNSGDFWVISEVANTILGLLQNGRALKVPVLASRLMADLPQHEMSADDLYPTLQSLIDNGLIQVDAGVLLPTQAALQID